VKVKQQIPDTTKLATADEFPKPKSKQPTELTQPETNCRCTQPFSSNVVVVLISAKTTDAKSKSADLLT
jgi:hypothetical protein